MTNRLLGRIGAAVLTVAVLAVVACPASADLIINVSDATVSPGEGGYLDVYFSSATGGEALAAYQVALDIFKSTLGDQTQVMFSQLSNAATNPLFTTSTPYLLGTVLPSTHLAAASDIPAGQNAIAAGSGLIRLAFTTTAASGGVYQVNFDSDPVWTNFTDGNGEDIAGYSNITLVGGTITVIPEPSTLVLLAMGLVGVVAYWRKRK